MEPPHLAVRPGRLAAAPENPSTERSARRVRDNGDLETFNCFCAKAYAGLDQKALVSTLLSRPITIRLERKKAGEQRERWIAPLTEPQAAALRDRCEAWAQNHVESLRGRQPELPAVLVNRAAEVWWALLSVSDEVGGDWPERARKAAKTLSTGGDAVDDAPEQVRLLADIRDAFDGGGTIFSKDLLAKLNGLDESPWGARRRGEGLDSLGLSRMLRPFKIRSRTVRIGVETAKGYHREQFADAFARHLPQLPPEPSQASQPSQPNAHEPGDVTDVTDVTAKSGPEREPCNDPPPEVDLLTKRERALAERYKRAYPWMDRKTGQETVR